MESDWTRCPNTAGHRNPVTRGDSSLFVLRPYCCTAWVGGWGGDNVHVRAPPRHIGVVICNSWKWVSPPQSPHVFLVEKPGNNVALCFTRWKTDAWFRLGCSVAALTASCWETEEKKTPPTSVLDSGGIVPSLSVIRFSDSRCASSIYFHTSRRPPIV